MIPCDALSMFLAKPFLFIQIFKTKRIKEGSTGQNFDFLSFESHTISLAMTPFFFHLWHPVEIHPKIIQSLSLYPFIRIQFPLLIKYVKQYKFMKTTNSIAIVLLLLHVVLAHNPHKPNPPLIPTFVTAWWPAPGASEPLPTGSFLASFEKLLQIEVNLIIFGDKALGAFIEKRRNKANTKFVEMDASGPTKSWHYEKVEQLKKSGQKLNANDAVTPLLSYFRMFLLDMAVGQDAFNTDEFIWVNPNALDSYQVEKIVQPKNIEALLLAFKHHFFILTSTKDTDVHAYPNIDKTYFENKFDTFVGGQLFGGKREAINTIFKIYEDLLKVVIQYDKNLWSEDALLSLLADRSPFLISYLSADDIKPPTAKRLLPAIESEDRFAEEKKELEYYEWLISLCEMGIVVMAILLGWEFIKFFKFTKKYNQRNLRPDVNLEASSLNTMN